jgi:subfamily B ATP-binding cassette protein MsbA
MNSSNKTTGLGTYIRLLGYVRPLWYFFIFSFLGHMLFASTQAAYAHLVKYFIEALEGGADKYVYIVPLAVVIIAFARGAGSFIGNYYMAKVAQRVVHDLRCEMFVKMLGFPCEYFENEKSGKIISKLIHNVGMVTTAASNAITVVIREGLTIIFLMAYLFWSNWKLTLVFLAVAPLVALVVTAVGKRLKRLSHNVQESIGEVTHVTGEAINGYRVMRTYGGERYEKERFIRASKDTARQNLKIQRTSAITTPVIQLMVILAMALIMFLVLSMRETSDSATLLAYIIAAGLIPKPLRQLSEVHSNIQKALAASERIFDHIDHESEKDNGHLLGDSVKGDISIRDLCFSYKPGQPDTLHNINLEIKAGQSLALVGPSGGGKSTLVSLLPRFYRYERGQILLDNVDINDYQLANLRQHIALVTQEVVLFNDTIANNIAYGELQNRSREEIIAAAEAAYAMEFINKMPNGLDTVIGENGVQLSGGQRQRLSIARAVLKDAPILILDEATSALDTESERYIQLALAEVMKNRTTLVIAHRLSTIENVDKIVVIEKGKIVEEGTHQELIAKGGVYCKLHDMQFNRRDEKAL